MARRVHDLRERAARADQSALRDQGQPDAGGGRPHGDPGRRPRRRLAAASCRSRWTPAWTPADISFAGPGKRDEELRGASAAGVTVNVESAGRGGTHRRHRRPARHPAQVAVRVNPDFELKSSGMKMGGGPKQFGIDAERVPEMLETPRRARSGLSRLSHLQRLAEPAAPKPGRGPDARPSSWPIGWPTTRRRPLQLAEHRRRLRHPLFPRRTAARSGADRRQPADPGRRRPSRALPGAEIVIELGRYLVGEAGVYVCRVIDRKVSRGQTFLVTDGGLHHHLAASGNFGQVMRKNYPVVAGTPGSTSHRRETVNVVGPLCTPLDLLARQDGTGRGRCRRPDRGSAIRSLRLHRQPAWLSQPSGAGRGVGLISSELPSGKGCTASEKDPGWSYSEVPRATY